MKLSTLQMIAILCILTIGFMTAAPFIQTAAAHDATLLCLSATAQLESYWYLVEYYCYSSAWDPYMCDLMWKLYGQVYDSMMELCSHDPNEEHD